MKSEFLKATLFLFVCSIGFIFPDSDLQPRTKTYLFLRRNKEALLKFKQENGFLPKTEQGLKCLYENFCNVKNFPQNGYLRRERTIDGWNREFYYERKSDKSFRLYSLGRDNKKGGQGEDEDFVTTNEE